MSVELEAEAAEVQLDVQRQAGVPAGQHEAVAAEPVHVADGSWRICRWNSVYASGARLIAVPGWPLPTFCTASAASTRTVSTATESTSVQSSGWLGRVRAEISSDCGHESTPRSASWSPQHPSADGRIAAGRVTQLAGRSREDRP